MAKEYKDQILDTSVNTKRVYNIVDSDGNIVAENISLEDKTVYSQEGTEFGAQEVNEIYEAIDEVNSSLTSSLNMRYNVLDDTIEIQIDGVWTKWKDAGMKSYFLLKDGVVHQDAGTIEKYNSSQYPNAPTSAEIVNGRLKVYGSYSDGNYNGMLTAFFSNIIDCTGFSKITVVVDELTQNGGSSNYCYLVKTNSKAFSTSTKIGDLTVGTNTFGITAGQGYIGVTDRNYTVLISEIYLHN